MELSGIKVFEDVNCTEDVVVERSLRERWLTWPWRPWVRTRVEKIPAIYKVCNPSQGMFSLGPSYFIVAHPAKLTELRVERKS